MCLLYLLTSCQPNCEFPQIRIYAEEFSWTSKDTCQFVYAECQKVDSMEAKVKYRGGISSAYFKHSYTVKLPDKISLAGLPADNDWIINASYIDKTFMRHKLSFDLFRQMGSYNIAPRSAYAEVFENGEYEGLYVVMERMDATRLKLDKKDSAAFVFKEPPLLSEETGNHDRDSLYRESQEFPNIRKGDRSQALRKLEKLIFEGDDDTFQRDIFSFLDMENLIDWQLLLLFSNNSDGQHKNYFIYQRDQFSPMRIALWDCDHSFGRDGDNELNMLDRVINKRRMLLFQRLEDTNPDNYRQKIRERWFELRRSVFTEAHIFEMIDSMDRQIRAIIPKNAEKWPVDSKWYFDDNTYEQEVNLMKEFIPRRFEQLDHEFRIEQ